MFIAVRHRAAGSSSVYFGPFETLEEGLKWAADNDLPCVFIELNPPETPIPMSVWMSRGGGA